jgi:hypothetical protein
MATTIDAVIQLRRGTDAERRSITFKVGEIVYSTDIKRTFIGDNSTVGGVTIGNITTIGTSPSPYAIKNDLFFNQNTSIMYMLTSNAGPDNIANYARVSPIADGVSLKYQDGKLSIDDNYFNNPATGFVHLKGDTMNGFLTLHSVPTATMHAATKGYTDTQINSLRSTIQGGFVHLSGDTMTGFLTLHHHPTAAYHAATKGYTDVIITKLADLSSVMTNGYVHLSGDTMIGPGYLTLNANPTQPMHAATKYSSENYTNQKIADLRLSTSNGYVHISGNDIITGPITIDSTFTVTQQSTFRKDVDFNNSLIKKFTPVVKTISVPVSYELSSDDNGSILVINGTGASAIVYVPSGLPKGFNVMLIQNTNATVYIRPKSGTTVALHNVDSFYAIRSIYGVANVVCTSTSPDNFVVAGDLAG